MIFYETKEDKFLELLRDDIHSFTNKSRRVSLPGDGSFPLSIVPNFPDPPCARSLFFFGDDKDEYLYLFIEKFKLIRVLNFERTIHSLPKSIETMIHLRYLRINLSKIVWDIPDSIGNLMNLETLFIEDRQVIGWDPSRTGIFKLQRLRNLYLKTILSLPYRLDEALRNLQVLSTAILCFDEEETFPAALDKFPCVRELGIQYFSTRNLNFEGESKAKDYLKDLHHLRYLQILSIKHFPMLPNDLNSFPLTITKLTLYKVRLRVGGGMTVLANLPNLRILKIKCCNDIIDLQIFGDSFPQLEVLKLQRLGLVKEWKQERSAMPCLRYLVIKDCEDLTMLPPELWSLTALQKVEVLHPNSELAHMLQELEMKVNCILRWSMGTPQCSWTP